MLKNALGKFVAVSVALAILAGGYGRPVLQKASRPLANAVVLIIRHAEKPDTGTDLSERGQKRARAYVDYFKDYKLNGIPLHLDRLFASADTKKSHRERLTLEPLDQALGKGLDLRFKSTEVAELVSDLRAHFYGHRFLICWHHGEIPDLIQAFGDDPTRVLPKGKWPDATFDWVVELHFDANGEVVPNLSKIVREDLELSGN